MRWGINSYCRCAAITLNKESITLMKTPFKVKAFALRFPPTWCAFITIPRQTFRSAFRWPFTAFNAIPPSWRLWLISLKCYHLKTLLKLIATEIKLTSFSLLIETFNNEPRYKHFCSLVDAFQAVSFHQPFGGDFFSFTMAKPFGWKLIAASRILFTVDRIESNCFICLLFLSMQAWCCFEKAFMRRKRGARNEGTNAVGEIWWRTKEK